MSLPKSTGCARLDKELVLEAWDWDWLSEPDEDEARARWTVKGVAASSAASEARAPGLQEPTHISVTTPGGEHVLVRSDPVQAGIEMNRSRPRLSGDDPEDTLFRNPQKRRRMTDKELFFCLDAWECDELSEPDIEEAKKRWKVAASPPRQLQRKDLTDSQKDAGLGELAR